MYIHVIFVCVCVRACATHLNDSIGLNLAARRCKTLQDAARRCYILQHTATHCNTLLHTATHCNTLQHTATHTWTMAPASTSLLFINSTDIPCSRENTVCSKDTLLCFFSRKGGGSLRGRIAKVEFLKALYLKICIYTGWTRVTRLLHMCVMTHSYVWHAWMICTTCLIHMCDMTHSHVWHDSFTCVTWLINTCACVCVCVCVCMCMCVCVYGHAIHTLVYCYVTNTLQHTATHVNTLQHTATHYNTLQHTATHCNKRSAEIVKRYPFEKLIGLFCKRAPIKETIFCKRAL